MTNFLTIYSISIIAILIIIDLILISKQITNKKLQMKYCNFIKLSTNSRQFWPNLIQSHLMDILIIFGINYNIPN